MFGISILKIQYLFSVIVCANTEITSKQCNLTMSLTFYELDKLVSSLWT